MTEEYLNNDIQEPRNVTTSEKQLQTEEPSFLQSHSKVNLVDFTNSTANYEKKPQDDLTVVACFMFLFQTFKERLIKNKNEVLQFVQLLIILIFGFEIAMIFGVANLLFQLCTKEENKHFSKYDINEIKNQIYREMKLPTKNQVNLRKKLYNLQEKRKKRNFRSETENSDTDEEEEIHVMPDLPSDIPLTSKFSITGKCGNLNISFEIDTGSGHSIINKETFDQIEPKNVLEVRQPTKTARDFSGNEIPFLAEVLLNIVFDKCSVKQTFLVSSFPNSTNLIGADCLRSKRINWEIDGDCKVFLVFKNWETKTVLQKLPVQENKLFPVFAQDTIQLPGGETTTLSAKLLEANINFINTKEIENTIGFTTLKHNFFPQEITGLCSLEGDGTLQIPIQNHEFGSKTIFKGEKIGTFELLPKNSKIYNPTLKIMETVNSESKIEPNISNSAKILEEKLKHQTCKKPKVNKTERKLEQENHRNPNVNKIKLSEPGDKSEAGDISDIIEEATQPMKIKVGPEIWEEVLKNVPPHLKGKVFKLLTKDFPNVVSKSNTDFGDCTLPNSEFQIELTSANPNVTSKPYKLHHIFEQQIQETIEEMIQNKLLIPESSPYSSGIFIRPRPDATNTGNVRVRVITDYRQLNSVTKADLFPLPSMKMLLQKLSGQQYFILLDLKDSYQSIRIKESDRFKASILTSFGQYQPCRMGYGFKNAPSWFSRQISRVIVGLSNAANYMDDIIIFGKSYEEAFNAFQEVIKRLDSAGFRISLPKLKMFQPELKLLGMIISQDGIRCDPSKVEGIVEFPEPTTKQQVMRFLGCCNFCSDFIPNYSQISAPLYKLTSSPNERITLNKEERHAFNKLKQMISKPTMLNFVDSTKPIFLEVDASGSAYGAVAYQVDSYSPEDIPKLKVAQAEIMSKKPTELTDSLRKIINDYISKDEIIDYDVDLKPSGSTQTEEELFQDDVFPYANTEIKTLKRKNVIFVPRTIFFTSKKFSETQMRGWSSLMKELFAILDICEKRADYLSIGKEAIILSDCAAVTYLFHQAKSNSLMARYLSRLSQFPFKIMVKHKAGEKLCLADNLSRVYTLDPERDENKIPHNQGILVKTPFQFGDIIGPEDIIEAISNSEDPIVIPTSSDLISKFIQTEDCCETAINKIEVINSIKGEILKEIKNSLTRDKYIAAQQEELKETYQELTTNERADKKLIDGIVMIKFGNTFRRLTPPSLRNAIISRTHLLGHLSSRKLIKIIQTTDFWPGMKKDIKDFCKTCLSCLWIRPPRGQQYKLGYPVTGQLGEVMQIDVVSGLKRTEKGSYFATCIDTFSRFVIAFPLRNDKSEEIVNKLETYVFSLFGPPRIIVTDGAMNLGKSVKMQELCNLYQTQIKIRSPYSSRSLGMCERAHSSILNLVRSLSDSFETNWSHNLPLAVAIYNSTPHLATGFSPYEIRFGYRNRMWDPVDKDILFRIKETNLNAFSSNHRKKLKAIHDRALANDKKYKEEMRKKGGRTAEFTEGSFILALNKTPAVNEKMKLRPKYYGPFIVRTNLESVVLAESVLNGKTTYIHKNFIRLIPEKSLARYRDMPLYAKKIFGGGVDWQHWEDLHKENNLMELIKLRNTGNTEYGVENPGVIDEFQPTLEAPEELVENNEQVVNPTGSSTEDEPDLEQPTQEQNSEEMNVGNRRVRFEIPETQERPKRLIKAPSKLNL